jgi:hypothetical protein
MKKTYNDLFNRAEAILEGDANGFGMPILHKLATRSYAPAMLSLAARLTENGSREDLGKPSDASSPAGLMYRAWRQGDSTAAQNLALTLFHLGDLAGYRRWLIRAAVHGDQDAAEEVGRFEVRKPCKAAKKTRRHRPLRRDGSSRPSIGHTAT